MARLNPAAIASGPSANAGVALPVPRPKPQHDTERDGYEWRQSIGALTRVRRSSRPARPRVAQAERFDDPQVCGAHSAVLVAQDDDGRVRREVVRNER